MASPSLALSSSRIVTPASIALPCRRTATTAALCANPVPTPPAGNSPSTSLSALPHARYPQPHASSPHPSPSRFPPALGAPLAALSAALLPALPALAEIAEGAAGVAEADGGDGVSAVLVAAAALAGAGAVFAGVKAYAYFQLQLVVARVMGLYVPKGGAVVVDLRTGNGRNLYYLPDDVSKLLALQSDVQPSLLKQQAVSAGVLIEVLPDGLTPLNRIPSTSIDAVITVDGFKPLSPSEAATVAASVARILKPERPLIFVEACESGTPGVPDATRPSFSFLPDDVLPLYEKVGYDYVLPSIDRHVVGVAYRSSGPSPASPDEQKAAAASSPSGFRSGKTGRKK